MDPLITNALHAWLVRRGVPRRWNHAPLAQSRHVATRLQSRTLGMQCKAGTDQRAGELARGCGGGGAGSGTASRRPARRGGLGRLRLLRPHRLSRRLRRRAGRLEFGKHRIGIDRWSRRAMAKSPGFRITWTGTVTGWNLGIVKVTVKPARGRARRPSRGSCSPVRARSWRRPLAAPNSSWTWTGGGVGLKESRENEEQPARLSPGDGNRDDTTHDQSLYCGEQPQSPAATIGA